MKASELIKNIQSLVDSYGDREIEVNGEFNNDFPINTNTFLEVVRVDLFADSNNYQILVKNDLI